jgi:response regulator RpfG family c-di-GMP phosphodiesterase
MSTRLSDNWKRSTKNSGFCCRFSRSQACIAEALALKPERGEDVRAATLLHDIGKLDVSRQVLYKAVRLTEEEFGEIKQHVEKGVALLEPSADRCGGSSRSCWRITIGSTDRDITRRAAKTSRSRPASYPSPTSTIH